MAMLRQRLCKALLIPVLLTTSLAFAQFENPIQVRDASILKPPPGAKIAIVEFQDLECPVCGHDNPIIMDAVAKYHVPWIHYDFPLPQHNWAFPAAVYAHWFAAKNITLADQYRNYIYANQPNIETKADLRSYTEKFATMHGTALPFVVDPQGKLAAQVKADQALGDRMGVHYTPTVWIVTNDYSHGKNYVQVTNFNDMFTMLDQAEAEVAQEK
jgi:protein-disulfide isomerase